MIRRRRAPVQALLALVADSWRWIKYALNMTNASKMVSKAITAAGNAKRNFGIVSTQSERGSMRKGIDCMEILAFTNFAIPMPKSVDIVMKNKIERTILRLRSWPYSA